MPKRKVKKWENKIKFNCTRFVRNESIKPDSCYNCGYRNGYPRNLGGDKYCENFNRRIK